MDELINIREFLLRFFYVRMDRMTIMLFKLEEQKRRYGQVTVRILLLPLQKMRDQK